MSTISNRNDGTVRRKVFGEMRIDETAAGPTLSRLCEAVTRYSNFFRPCKMLVSKRKRENGKGFECVYDNPKTPLRRLLESGAVDSKTTGYLLEARSKTSGILLLGQIRRLIMKVCNIQKNLKKIDGAGLSLISALGRSVRNGEKVQSKKKRLCPVFDELGNWMQRDFYVKIFHREVLREDVKWLNGFPAEETIKLYFERRTA